MNAVLNLFKMLVFLVVFNAQAQGISSIPCPDLQVGQKVKFLVTEFSSTRKTEEVITKVEGGVVYTDSGNVYDIMWNMINVKGVAYAPKYYNHPECPFKLGQKQEGLPVSWDFRGKPTKASLSISVDDKLTSVTTSLGTFDGVVKITSIGVYSAGGFSGTMERITYYSPKLGLPVAVEFQNRPSSGARSASKMELDQTP